VLIRERTRLTAELISRLPNLKLIATIGMANAAIDLEATPVLTWALLLAVTRNLYSEAGSVRAGGWH